MSANNDYKHDEGSICKADFMTRLRSSEDHRVEAGWFIENVFEIAFGDGALFKDFTYQEVLGKLDEFSALALLAGEVDE